MAIEIKAVSGFRKYPKITSPISLCTQLEVDISLQIILMDSLLADLNAAMEASLTPRDLHNVHILEYFSNICVLDRPCFILASLTGRNQISFLPYGVLRISGISGLIRCDCMSVFLWRLKTAQIPLNRKGWLSRIYESMQKLTSQSLRIYRCKQVLLQVAQCRWDSSILRIGRSEVEITLHFPGFELHGMYSWRSCRVQAVKSKKWHWIEFSSSPFCFWTYNSVVLWEFMDRLIPSVI